MLSTLKIMTISLSAPPVKMCLFSRLLPCHVTRFACLLHHRCCLEIFLACLRGGLQILGCQSLLWRTDEVCDGFSMRSSSLWFLLRALCDVCEYWHFLRCRRVWPECVYAGKKDEYDEIEWCKGERTVERNSLAKMIYSSSCCFNAVKYIERNTERLLHRSFTYKL